MIQAIAVSMRRSSLESCAIWHSSVDYIAQFFSDGAAITSQRLISAGTIQMAGLKNAFDPKAFLANAGGGRHVVQLKAKQTLFTQGTPADCVFLSREGERNSLLFRRAARKPP